MNNYIKYYLKNNLLTNMAVRNIERLFELSENELLELYNHDFIRMFKYATKHSEFYSEFYGMYGVNGIRDLSDLKRIPVLDKSLIKKQGKLVPKSGLLSVKGLTSGTTGSPMTLYRSPMSIIREQAYLNQYRNRLGYKPGQPLLSIRGMLGKSSWEYFNPKANILYLSGPDLNEHTIEKYYKKISAFNPVAIEAYPSYLHKLCVELSKKKLSIEIPLTFTSSETLLEFQRENIEQLLKTEIYDWYGNAERTILIAQDQYKQYNPLPLYSINEYEEDYVITTSLINNYFPLIRYKVDDIIKVSSADWMKNIVKPEIISINGRSSDYITLKDGSHVGCIDHAFKGVRHLEMAQVHQYNPTDPIEIKLITDQRFTGNDENHLRDNLKRMSGEKAAYIFTYCKREELTYSPNGKFRLIIKDYP